MTETMDIVDYHAHPALGSTGLRALLRSPAHFQALAFGAPSPAMRLGTLVHTLVLEPEAFAERYIVAPACDRRTKAGKETWAAFVDDAGERDVITEDDEAKGRACAQSLLSHRVGQTIKGASVEQTLMWTDAETGVICKARPDVLPSGYLVDVKISADASPTGFAKSIANYGYHVQAAHYVEGARACGHDVKGFVFAVVETVAPYLSAGYVLSAADLDQGMSERKRALEIYAQCTASGEWPGYAGGRIEEIEMPYWAWSDERKAAR